MAGLVPAIHAFWHARKTWMCGTSPRMTRKGVLQLDRNLLQSVPHWHCLSEPCLIEPCLIEPCLIEPCLIEPGHRGRDFGFLDERQADPDAAF
jgi:hypothetical protein